MELDQFMDGLSLGGVLKMMQDHPRQCAVLLEGRKPRELTTAALRDIMNFEFTGEPGSNNRMAQETVTQGWIMFLQASEAGEAKAKLNETAINITLSDVMMWLTGLEQLPCEPSTVQIDIKFEKRELPKINTCGYAVFLPLSERFQDLDSIVDELDLDSIVDEYAALVVESQGFGSV
ncbi:uncharacterized protein [Asterias amurensis]|uniref:uncharacterized protein n=1 Tax=Asterias amurensis TaxID=7602 RepID=UPI003AB259BC